MRNDPASGAPAIGDLAAHRAATPPVTLTMVVAVTRNGVIGRDGDLPFRQPSDLARFKALTVDRPIIMGRKTLAAIGKALPRRTNIVITRADTLPIAGAQPAGSPQAALDLALAAGPDHWGDDTPREIAVIGGGQIYSAFLPVADVIYLTRIDAELTGDTSFPALSDAEWTLAGTEVIPKTPQDDHAMTLETYHRRS